MKKIIFVLMLMLISGNLTAQGLTKHGEITNSSTVFVDKYGKTSSTPALNKSGAVAHTGLAIGDSYGGGKVAYILKSGDPGYQAVVTKGFIAANSDQSTGIVWAKPAYQSLPAGATATALGTGSASTDLIVAQNGAGTDYAAGIARAVTDGGYSDWFLPSQNELDKLYDMKVLGFGNFAEATYYCTTESSDGTTVARRLFNTGQYGGGSKASLCRVRAIRSFAIVELPSITIGTQTWTAKNLEVTTYRDGSTITYAANATEWIAASSSGVGAWCYYDNSSENGTTYGKLYNWYAVNDSRGLAPTGWHVASNAEWTTLSTYLDETVAAQKLKEAGTAHWPSPNTGATDAYGFTALPGGYIEPQGTFKEIGVNAYWWTSTFSNPNARYIYMESGFNSFGSLPDPLDYGFPVRCIRD